MFTVSKRFNLENQHGDMERAKDVRDLARHRPVFAVAYASPLKTGLVPRTVIAVNTMIIMVAGAFLSLASDLNAALGLGSSKVIMMADGYVSARRRDADPLKCQ